MKLQFSPNSCKFGSDNLEVGLVCNWTPRTFGLIGLLTSFAHWNFVDFDFIDFVLSSFGFIDGVCVLSFNF